MDARFCESITTEEIQQLPYGTFAGNIIVVQSLDKITSVVDELKKHKVIGFDTESKPSFKKGKVNRLAMLQLSVDHTCYLIRINKVGFPEPLKEIFARPDILKIGVAIHEDLGQLSKIIHLQPKGFVDLQKICSDYGINDKSLKKLAAIILGMRISKSQQTSNWEAEVLSDSQLAYAATDAWVCREMYLKLIDNMKI
jgi:ribonuclease D